MKRKILILICAIILIYLSSYAIFRQTHIEIWEKDAQAYVIFPENKLLYYFYRPLAFADGKLTNMRFHIGQHQ
jgi:hypothetical protein